MAEITGSISTASLSGKINAGGTVEVPLEWVVISETQPDVSSPAIIWVKPSDTEYSMYMKVNGVWSGVPGFKGETGPAGPAGIDGVSVLSAIVDNAGRLVVTLSNGTVTTSASLIGPQGPQGEKGDKGDKGEKGADGTMTFEDLTPEQKASLKGDKGDKGDTGETGATGPAGAGISSIVTNADNTLTITYGDGSTVTTASVIGPQGPKGDTGAKGDKGDKGDTGATGATGPAGTNGTDGYTPVRGTDYWTQADQTAIINAVLAALPAAESVTT